MTPSNKPLQPTAFGATDRQGVRRDAGVAECETIARAR